MLSDNLNSFALERLVCPISKRPMTRTGNDFASPCGFRYKAADFRIGLEFSDKWAGGQAAYEEFQQGAFRANERAGAYDAIDAETRDVYERITMSGDVLDIGGGFATIIRQANLDPSRYIAVDPMPCRWADLAAFPVFGNHYAASAAAPRLVAFAEFLPLSEGSFDTIHMRSCIDHFANPILALKEGFRVLREGGKLVVGISLEGAYLRNGATFKDRLKPIVASIPGAHHLVELIRPDHHLFHPTRDSLLKLIEAGGFSIVQEVSQACYHNVLYVEATKRL